MEEAEALADSCQATKRRQLMAAPEDNNNNNFFSVSFRHCGSSDNLCSLQGNNQTAQNASIYTHLQKNKCFVLITGLKPREEESLQMSMMQDEDIAKLLDWESESGEISNGQSSVITTEDNLVLDDHQLASLFPVDDDNNNNTNMNPTLSSCSWDNFPGSC